MVPAAAVDILGWVGLDVAVDILGLAAAAADILELVGLVAAAVGTPGWVGLVAGDTPEVVVAVDTLVGDIPEQVMAADNPVWYDGHNDTGPHKTM